MDLAHTLIQRFFGSSDGELHVSGVPITEVADRYGTPLFVYDARVMERKWSALREALPPEFSISYSVKANPNPAVLRHFLGMGSGLEVASAGELRLALSAGCPPDRILFAGPGKTETELELALASSIGEIHIESPREAGRVGAIARKIGTRAGVAIRVNPSAEAQGGAMRMGGKPAPFGVDEESLDEVLALLMADPFLDVRGVHLFTGTQILDAAILLGQYEKAFQIARRVAQILGRPLRTLDFGGGFGIPYFAHEQELDLEAFRAGLAGLMTGIAQEAAFAGTRFVVEPGRFLVGESGIYVTRVNDIKVSRGKKFLICDGGMNHHLAASGNLGQVIKRNFPVAVLNRLDEAAREAVDVVGPLCTPLDVLAREAEVAIAQVGDLIGVFQSGAYGRSASPLGFLSHPAPPEVMVRDGRAVLIRERESLDELADGVRRSSTEL